MTIDADAEHSGRILSSVAAIMSLFAAPAIAQDRARLPEPAPRSDVSLEDAPPQVHQTREAGAGLTFVRRLPRQYFIAKTRLVALTQSVEVG